jgi:hypothetical protein
MPTAENSPAHEHTSAESRLSIPQKTPPIESPRRRTQAHILAHTHTFCNCIHRDRDTWSIAQPHTRPFAQPALSEARSTLCVTRFTARLRAQIQLYVLLPKHAAYLGTATEVRSVEGERIGDRGVGG